MAGKVITALVNRFYQGGCGALTALIRFRPSSRGGGGWIELSKSFHKYKMFLK